MSSSNPPIADSVNSKNAALISNNSGPIYMGDGGAGPAIRALNSRYVQDDGQLKPEGGFIDELSIYVGRALTAETRVRLSAKLKRAGRGDQIDDAKQFKELCAKVLSKYEFSHAAQKILAHILCFINDQFNAHVKPLIVAGKTRTEIDTAVVEHVIGPAMQELDTNPLELSRNQIWGMVYFITSKCRIWWDH